MHSFHHGECAHLALTLAPGVHPAPHHAADVIHALAAVPWVVPGRLWGSLLAAPVAILGRHVTWPVNRTLPCPLIGTL